MVYFLPFLTCRTKYYSQFAEYVSDVFYASESICCRGYVGIPPNCKGTYNIYYKQCVYIIKYGSTL